MVGFFNNTPTFDKVSPVVFDNKRFHFSGKFEGYSKPEFAAQIERLGGICKTEGSLNKKKNKADYFVVGKLGYEEGEGEKERLADEYKIPKITQLYCQEFIDEMGPPKP